MDKALAVRQIHTVADWNVKNILQVSEDMQGELINLLDCYLSEEKVSHYNLLNYENGFYLGEIQNNERHGFGALLRYNSPPPNSVYIGYWEHGSENGEGFNMMTTNSCYYGGFINGKYHGERCHLANINGVHLIADYCNGEIKKVHYSNQNITYNGKSYGGNGGSSSSGGRSGSEPECFAIIVVIAIIWGCFKFCGNCSSGSDTKNRTEIYEAATIYICTAKKSLKVRTSPSTSASQMGSIMSGEEVEVYNISDGFAKIRYNGSIGYASSKYLKQK